MNHFEEANEDIAQAIELGDRTAAFRVAREALYEASQLNMGDLSEQLQHFIDTGDWIMTRNVLTAMGVKQRGEDARKMHLTLYHLRQMGFDTLPPLGEPYPLV